MSVCYSCNTILNRKNESVEHVIPNSIGGVLKSRRLLCRECNSAYGMTIDAALAKDFENLAAFIHIPRDRARSHIIKNAIAANGDLYHLEDGRRPVTVKPSIKFENGSLHISGRNRQQVIQIANGLKRKFPNLDMASIERNLRDEDVLADHDLTIDFSVGSDLFMRSVAKIAVGFYLMKVRGLEFLSKIIPVINGITPNQNHIHYYPLPDGLWQEQEVSHIISVKGSVSTGQLFAQVILFNTYHIIVSLCDDYDGSDVDLFYRYDILKGEDSGERIHIPYDRSKFPMDAKGDPNEWNSKLIASIQNNLGRVLQIAQRRHSDLSLVEVVEMAFDKAIASYPAGTIISQDIVNGVHGKVFDAVNDFLRRNNR